MSDQVEVVVMVNGVRYAGTAYITPTQEVPPPIVPEPPAGAQSGGLIPWQNAYKILVAPGPDGSCHFTIASPPSQSGTLTVTLVHTTASAEAQVKATITNITGTESGSGSAQGDLTVSKWVQGESMLDISFSAPSQMWLQVNVE